MDPTDSSRAKLLRDDDAEDAGSEEDEEVVEVEQEIDPEIVALREEIEQFEARIQEEKALGDKAEAARRAAQEQLQSNEEQITERRKELAQIELECGQLMTEGRMYQLASREFDLPLKETWTDKPEQALVVDLSRIMRTLEQAARQINTKVTPSGSSETFRSQEIEVIRVSPEGEEIAKTNIPVKSVTMVGDVLKAAASYWSLEPEDCEMENSQGRKLIRKDAIPADTTQLILKDRLKEAEERAFEERLDEPTLGFDNDLDQSGLKGSDESEDQSGKDLMLSSYGGADGPPGAVTVQVGRDPITKRDARFCHHIEFLMIVLLATTFVAMTLEFRQVTGGFLARESIKRMFADQPVAFPNASQPQFNFFQADSNDRMWLWLTQTASVFAFTAPFDATCANNSNISYAFTALTLSQLRVQANSDCTPVNVNGIPQSCYGQFFSPQVIVPFANIDNVPLEIKEAFEYNSAPQTSSCSKWPSLVRDSFTGFFNYYPARQLDYYSIQLSRGAKGLEQVELLRSNNWVDASTRLVAAEFTAVSKVNGAVVNVLATFEILPTNLVYPKWNSIPLVAQVNDLAYELAFLILGLILVLFTILGVVFNGFRNRLGILFIDALLAVFVVLFFAGNKQLDGWIEACSEEILGAGSTGYIDFRGPAFQYQLVGNLAGVVVLLFAIRLGRHINASPSASMLVRAFSKAIPQYVSLFFFVAMFAGCFALMAHFIFGRTFADFFVGDLAFASLWVSYSIGNSGAFTGVAHWGAIVLSLAAYIVMFLVILPLCFAATAAAYMTVSDEVRKNGYHWVPGVSGSSTFARYADEVVAASGAISGVDATKARENHRASERKFG